MEGGGQLADNYVEGRRKPSGLALVRVAGRFRFPDQRSRTLSNPSASNANAVMAFRRHFLKPPEGRKMKKSPGCIFALCLLAVGNLAMAQTTAKQMTGGWSLVSLETDTADGRI
jgi:hypothetical protein